MIREFGFSDLLFLLHGAKWTLLLSAIAFAGGGLGGLGIALARTAPYRWLNYAAAGFIEFFQGTPLLMQLFVVYFGVAFLNISLSPLAAVAIGLTLHATAFLGEIWRGCIQAVDRGQTEAAKALGLSYGSRMRHVVLPQAFKFSLPATIGFMVQLIKGTSLAAIIGFTELARSGQITVNTTFQPLVVYGLVAIIYFIMCWPLSALSDRLERRFAQAN
jgi:polar amino acid transport system permease protein